MIRTLLPHLAATALCFAAFYVLALLLEIFG